MAELKTGSADLIKEAFVKVREDIDFLKKEINNNKKDLFNQKELSESLNKKIEEFLLLNNEIREELAFFKISTGNKGVSNNQQQSTTISNNTKQASQLPTDAKIDQTLTFRFKNLSDREFSVFLAIYEIEQEIGEVGFTELAHKLNLSESAIRNVVYNLLSKQIPLSKDRFFHKKVSLSIHKEFKGPKMIRELINLRQSQGEQTTLPS